MTADRNLRVVFIGSVDFSAHCLDILTRTEAEIVGVLTPFKEAARINADYVDLGPIARSRNIPVHYIAKINAPEAIETVRSLAPDVIFTFGFSQLISHDLLAIPPLGVIGTHPTLLPEGRGRHPLIWTLVKGLDHGGLTFFYMDAGADTGDILWQQPFDVTDEDDATSLYGKIKHLAETAIPEIVRGLAGGVAPRRRQDDSKASVWPKRGEADGLIHWSAPSRDIRNLVRGLTRPYLGAHTFLNGRRIVIWRIRPCDDGRIAPSMPPGRILETTAEGGFIVAAGDGALEVCEWDSPDGASPRAGDTVEGPRT